MENEKWTSFWPDWVMVRRIGQGSFGTVYEAERRDVVSKAAIKVISIPQNETEFESLLAEGMTQQEAQTYLHHVVTDFVAEIQLMESLKGVQNIVNIEDYKVVEKEDGSGWNIYIRMELLTPLTKRISEKELTQDEIVQLGIDMCSALEFCAKRSVIHRDIKPENIFINEFGNYKLGDFGVARKLENVSGGLSQKGSYYYMAPEVEKGTNYDATVDIYSLGVVLYRFLNHNRLPFIDTNEEMLSPSARQAAVRRRLDGEPLPELAGVSDKLMNVVQMACDPNPSVRFRTATAMKKALEACLGEEQGEGTVYLQRRTAPVQTAASNEYTTMVNRGQAALPPDEAWGVNSGPVGYTQPKFEKESKVSPKLAVLGVLLFVLLGVGLGFVAETIRNRDVDSAEETVTEVAETTDASTEAVTTQEASTEGAAGETVTVTENTSETQETTGENTTGSILTGVTTDTPPEGLTQLSKLIPATGSASSTLEPDVDQGYSYEWYKAVDGDTITSWQENIKDEVGLGEYITLQFAQPVRISGIQLHLGNWRNAEQYEKNGRPTGLELQTDGGSNGFVFSDVMTPHYIVFDSPLTTQTLQFTITGALGGEELKDTCISEITCYGETDASSLNISKYMIRNIGTTRFGVFDCPGATWEEASSWCAANGGTLAMIKTQAIQEGITILLNEGKQLGACAAQDYYYLGGTDRGYSVNDFHWLDGTSVAAGFTNWDDSAPDNTSFDGDTEDYIGIINEDGLYGCPLYSWNDFRNDSKYKNRGFICMWENAS